MNLKRIIREELDDMDWIRNIDASKFRPELGDSIEVRNKGSEEAYHNWLGDYAGYWKNGDYGYHIQGKVESTSRMGPNKGKVFVLIEENTGDGIYFPYHEHMSELIQEQPDKYKGLDLQYLPTSLKAKPKTIKLKESDDLDWIKDIPVDNRVTTDNWYQGMRVKLNPDSIFADQSEEIGVIIDSETDLYFCSEKDSDSNDSMCYWIAVEWEDGYENNYRIGPYEWDLLIDADSLNIKESDELDWIKDVEPPSYDSLVGKALYFDPPIQKAEELASILRPLKLMGFHYGDWVYDFEWYEDDEDSEIIGLYFRRNDGGITYTTWTDEDYQEHISDWAGEDVTVLDGWNVLQPFIPEK